MRVATAAIALVALVAAARADTGAGDLGPEAKRLVDAWLAAQNKGDFAAYEKLYAARFTGVRRSGTRAVPLDRKGWMADRGRMFQKPMKVSASDVKIGATPASARVTLVQEFESGSYHDRGPKQLVVVREAGVARIAQEEMIASEKSGASAPAAGSFALVLGKYAILDPDAGEEWATGAARLDDDGDPLVTSKRATGLPPALAAYAGKKLIVQSAGAEPCTATVKELRVVGLVVPHFGTRQDWRDGKTSARKQAQEAWDLSAKMLGAVLDGCATSEPAFARAAAAPIELVAPAKETALRAAAIAALRKLPSWRALQKEYASGGGKGKWDASANDAEVDVERWELPGRPLVTVSAHAFDGCGGFGGEVFAVFNPKPDGTLTLVAEPPALRPTGALLLDGAPAFFGTQSWSDFGTALQIVPLKGEARKIEVPYLDCPC